MATSSPLHLITSNPLSGSIVPFRTPMKNTSQRSPFSSTNFSKIDLQSRILFNGLSITNHRSYTSTTVMFDQQSSCRSPMCLEPVDASLSLSVVKERFYVNFNAPGLEKTESDEELCLFLNMHGVPKENVKARIEHEYRANFLVIEGATHEAYYMGMMVLPENVDKTVKGEMKDGMFKLTFRKVKDEQLLKKSASFFGNMMDNFRFELYVLLGHVGASLGSVILPFIFKCLCQYGAEGVSFTVYKKKSAESLQISLRRGLAKMEITGEVACVSLNMPELKIEDLKSYFKRDAFFIEGKAETEMNKVNYITGIRLPKSVVKKRKMIKTEMQEGMYKATLPNMIVEIKIK